MAAGGSHRQAHPFSSSPLRDVGSAHERAPLVTSPDSPSGMASLKHRAAAAATGGGGLGDGLQASAASSGDRSLPTDAAAASTVPGLSPSVLLCVAVASMGALSFGYHLGVVNGPLEVLAQQLGFGGNASLQGLVRLLLLRRRHRLGRGSGCPRFVLRLAGAAAGC